MVSRTTTTLIALVLGAPAVAWSHPGLAPHVHPHGSLWTVAAVLGLAILGAVALLKQRAIGGTAFRPPAS